MPSENIILGNNKVKPIILILSSIYWKVKFLLIEVRLKILYVKFLNSIKNNKGDNKVNNIINLIKLLLNSSIHELDIDASKYNNGESIMQFKP